MAIGASMLTEAVTAGAGDIAAEGIPGLPGSTALLTLHHATPTTRRTLLPSHAPSPAKENPRHRFRAYISKVY